MRKELEADQASRSLAMILAIFCLVSISADLLIVGVDGKKDKDKGKGGNMVVMMGGGYGGGKGGGGGAGSQYSYGGGGGGGYSMPAYPMSIPMPMPIFCPPSFGRAAGGGARKSGARRAPIKEKIVIVPIPAQMLSGEKEAASGYDSPTPASAGYGGGAEGYRMVAEMPVVRVAPYGGKGGGSGGGGGGHYGGGGGGGGGHYGGISMREGSTGGYEATSHAYAIELSPLSRMIDRQGAMGQTDYPFDQYASGSNHHQAALREGPPSELDAIESSYAPNDHSADQFDLQAAASGENNPPASKHTEQPSHNNSDTNRKAESVPNSGSQNSPRSRR